MYRLKGLRDANERAKLTVNLATGSSYRQGVGTDWTLGCAAYDAWTNSTRKYAVNSDEGRGGPGGADHPRSV